MIPHSRRTWLARAVLAAAGARSAAADASPRGTLWPPFRVAEDGWGEADHDDVRAVLRSGAAELWRYFPDHSIPRFHVVRGYRGPIVHYERNVVGEIVMRLDTHDRFWCQYVYQFAHEFCHILAGFDDDWPGNKWFEETICEIASLFVLRRLSHSWRHDAPRRNWRSYAPEFAKYADGVIRSRTRIAPDGLAAFFRRHEPALRRNPSDRALNGAMAVALLPVFEADPASWEAVAWLNSRPSAPGESFAACLHQWLRAVPPRRRDFVRSILRRFDIPESLPGPPP